MAEQMHVLTFLVVAIVGLCGLGMMINDNNAITGMGITAIVQQGHGCSGYENQRACGSYDQSIYKCESQARFRFGWFNRINMPPTWKKIQDCSPQICQDAQCISSFSTVPIIPVITLPPATASPTPSTGRPVPQPAPPPIPIRKCVEGATRCVGINVEICLNNQWMFGQTCKPGTNCIGGQCVPTAEIGLPSGPEVIPPEEPPTTIEKPDKDSDDKESGFEDTGISTSIWGSIIDLWK